MRRLILLAIALGFFITAGQQRLFADGCPAPIGLATSCGVVITINADNTLSFATNGSGFLDGVDDPLVEIINNSDSTVNSVYLTGPGVFAFNGDGLCSGYSGAPEGCPYDLTVYAGPNTWFSSYNSLGNFGTVNFSEGLASGGSAYFSLENAPTGGNPGSATPEPASLLLLGTGLVGLGAVVRSRLRKRP